MNSGLLDLRTYRYKKNDKTIYCPLCRSERVMRVRPRLNLVNHAQILLATLVTTAALSSFFGLRTLFVYFVYWAAFEMTARMLYKCEVPCPHCGFDATLYKRDITVARQKVQDFWREKEAQSSSTNA